MLTVSSGFLSCLSGSDVREPRIGVRLPFLSCLSGSDVTITSSTQISFFLSCLSGSDGVSRPDFSTITLSELPVRQ